MIDITLQKLFVSANIFTRTPGIVRVYERQNATFLWEYYHRFEEDDFAVVVTRFYYAGYKSGRGYILRKDGFGSATPAEEYRGRITCRGYRLRVGFTLHDVVAGDVAGGRYRCAVQASSRVNPDVVHGDSNDDAILSIYRK